MASPPPPPDTSPASDLERRVMAMVMASETRGDSPWLCAIELGRCCASGESASSAFPSADLASILVSNICFSRNTPFMWKLLEQTMATKLVYPLHVLALLTARVVHNRREQPQAYRLYLELMRRYAISFSLLEAGPHKERITKSIDNALQLSSAYQVEKWDLGMAVVLFLVGSVTSLIDCALQDWDFLVLSGGQHVNKGQQSMEVNVNSRLINNTSKYLEQLKSEPFKELLQRVELLKAQTLSSESLPQINHLLKRLFCHIQKASSLDCRLKRGHLLEHVLGTRLTELPVSQLISSGKSGCWIPFDILMEDVMDGKTSCPASAIEMITRLTKTLQVVNQASWHETFQALWISALRLVQRARNPMAGPIPYIEARLSMLLSIIPLSIASLLKEKKNATCEGTSASSRKQSLFACLQSLSQFSSLLHPPQSVASAANDAATKAAKIVRDLNIASSNQMMHHKYSTLAGNLLHLIVESCIARDLIDTKAYFWPGYLLPSEVSIDTTLPQIQHCPWSNFMQGAPLTRSLQNVLINIPAPSITELKKLHHLALHGSDEEGSAASKVLCGASLSRGWNIQEHVVHIVVRLLSPQITLGSTGTGDANSYLGHIHMLAPLLCCLSRNYIIHILSLYGLVPDVVAALMPLCEAFGSFPPPSTNQSDTEEDVSPYSVFSFAFLFLLRLCKFYGPDKEFHSSSCGGPVHHNLKLNFLLLMRNSHIQKNSLSDRYYVNNVADPFHDLRTHPVYADSFPKLNSWYFENQACLESDLSNKCHPSRMHLVANKILVFICRNMKKDEWSTSSSCSTITSTSSSSFCSSTSSSSVGVYFEANSGDDNQGLPHYPAWEMLEAVPLVLDAIYNACAYGRISSRDLTIGLRDLVAFLPASVAAIIRYFKAEITCGTWKCVQLNGIDWPSPAEALDPYRLEINKVLELVVVRIKNSYPQNVQPVLPLPVAAFLSLTITFKLDKNSEHTGSLTGQAIENYALYCPWPIMLTIGALWLQKAPIWRDFIILMGTRSHFAYDKDAVNQLLSSCFKAYLDPASLISNFTTSRNGLVGLLGESICDSLAMHPGILFLSTCHMFSAPHYFSDVICKLVVEWTGKVADEWTLGGPLQFKYGQRSLAAAICAVRQVAILGATLLCVAGRSPSVQYLFEETVPTFLLSMHEERSRGASFISSTLEGYAISYLLFFSVAILWGVQATNAPDKHQSSSMPSYIIASHLGFIAKVSEGSIVLGCNAALWKAHVSSFVGLIVKLAPSWVPCTKFDELKKISSSLREWHENDLALSLLVLGGISSIEAVLDSLF